MTAAFLNLRAAAARPAIAAKATRDMVRLIGLDRLPAERTKLVCRWHSGADGRLACVWEPDMASRASTSTDAN